MAGEVWLNSSAIFFSFILLTFYGVGGLGVGVGSVCVCVCVGGGGGGDRASVGVFCGHSPTSVSMHAHARMGVQT